MEALVAVALLFLPAIVYFVRSPYKPQNADVLGYLLSIFLLLTILFYIGNWLFPKTGGNWFAVIGWLIMCINAWLQSGHELANYNYRKKARAKT